jgi:hypothetical protein
MHARRLLTLLGSTVLAILITAGLAGPASAATAAEKLSVMSSWSQTSASSQNAFLSARASQDAWSSYEFDWSTDYCSSSPDNPLGFDFKNSCARHDFGYRNYKAMGQFPANKSRIDSAFYEDLKRKCATYNAAVRPACTSLAWTYYEAVKAFGSVVVDQADLDRAAALKARGLAAAAR